MVFGQKSSNREIYDSVIKNMTKVVLGGYNATIFAYGVTGAGKTHTMIGYEDEPGLMYYTINDMFEGMKSQSR
jgi:kinesin family protein 18/19